MNPALKSRIAVVLTAGVLLGVLVAAVLLLLNGYWHPGPVIRNLSLGIRNGHKHASWTLATHKPVRLRVTTSDRAFCSTWPDKNLWREDARWDEITVTVGDRDGTFFWDYKAVSRAGGTGTSGSAGERVKSLVFRNLLQRGHAPPGTVLGTFTRETENGDKVEGEISVDEVTPRLPDRERNPTTAPEPNKTGN